MYGLIASAAGALVALAVAFGTGWHYGAKGPRADLARIEAKVARDDAARAMAKAEREVEDERNAGILRAREAASALALQFATARLASLEAQAADLAAQLRAAGADRVLLPAAARRMFDDAARSGGGGSTEVPAAAPDTAADAGDAAGAPPYAGGVAALPGDHGAVDVVTVWEVGRRNTGRAAFNAAALMAEQRARIALWEACNGETYPTAELAPWLN